MKPDTQVNAKPILSCKNITLMFGGLSAVKNFNLEIYPNELVGLIGPNGAGKTSVFNIITGVYVPTKGTYQFLGEPIKKMPTHQLVKRGLVRTFQNIRLFKHMTVLDNVMSAHNFHMKYSLFQGTFRLPGFWKEENQVRQDALELLEIFDLARYWDYEADNLPYGQQRKLEIARAMATNPKLLLLDEPAAGMNPKETEELMATIELIKERFKISVLLIEHDMRLVLGICERVVVLDHGSVIATGKPKDVVNDPKVIEAYLGSEKEN